LDENDINHIIGELDSRGYKNNYFLQNFLQTDDNIGNISSPNNVFDKSLLSNIVEVVWR
jgi:pyruvate formate lyase activating enzyme